MVRPLANGGVCDSSLANYPRGRLAFSVGMNDTPHGFYAALGLTFADTSDEAIKKAYRKQSLKWHPVSAPALADASSLCARDD